MPAYAEQLPSQNLMPNLGYLSKGTAMTMEFINFLARWGHGLFGITWIGMLYYFNFIQIPKL